MGAILGARQLEADLNRKFYSSLERTTPLLDDHSNRARGMGNNDELAKVAKRKARHDLTHILIEAGKNKLQ